MGEGMAKAAVLLLAWSAAACISVTYSQTVGQPSNGGQGRQTYSFFVCGLFLTIGTFCCDTNNGRQRIK